MRYTLFVAVLALFASCDSDDAHHSFPTGPFLKSVTWYQENDDDNFVPGEKSEYNYSDGRLLNAKHYAFDTQEETFTLRSTETFTYNKGLLVSITEKYQENNMVHVVSYEYKNGVLARILVDQDVNTTISIRKISGDTLEAHYAHDNGRSFTYRFCSTADNIVYEETWNESGKKASVTVNEFDGKVNPFSLLGYVDPMFSYFSKSNKTKTQSEYFSDAFPESVPSGYTYQYLENNLPAEQIITYRSYAHGTIVGRAKRVFEYQ